MRERLGAGGMGEIYRAHDRRLQVDVAVKCLHAFISRSPAALKRFRREALATAQLVHPNIVRVTDVDLDADGHPFFVMELLEGDSVKDIILEGRLQPERAVAIASQVLDGLAKAHARVVHRDLKPSNLMVQSLRSGDHVKILDFGIAKLLDDATEDLTLEGHALGTPGYMPPEVLVDGLEKDDPRLYDIYALGVTLYEMLTGRRPWGGSPSMAAALQARDGAEPPSLRELVPGIPAKLVDVVERAMARRPQDRYQSAEEMARALSAVYGKTEGASPDVAELLTGTVVADTYRIVERIGAGGYGVVYRAEDLHLRRQVALKLMLGAAALDDETRARLEREGALAAKIDHPNVVRVFAAGTWAGHAYLAMELVEGETLRERWEDLGWGGLLAVVEQVAGALDAIHDQQVIHRDLSPENILIERASGRARVTDFGIARPEDSKVTGSVMQFVLGRLGYMAPEQARDPRAVGPAADQWSLAAIVYEALCGKPPFHEPGGASSEAEELAAVGDRLQQGKPPAAIHSRNHTVSAGLENVVLRALGNDPSARFPTATEFARALRAETRRGVLLGVAVQPEPGKTAPRRGLVVGIIAAVAALATVGVVASRLRSQAPAMSTRAIDAAPAPSLARLRVDSDPAGGVLVLGDQRLLLPTVVERPLGTRIRAAVEHGGRIAADVDLGFDTLDRVQVVTLPASPDAGIVPKPAHRAADGPVVPKPPEYRRGKLTIELGDGEAGR